MAATLVFGSMLLIFAIWVGFHYLCLVGLPLLVIFGAWKCGKILDEKFQTNFQKYVFVLLIVAVPGLWAYLSLNEIDQICKLSPGIQIYSTAGSPQDGLFLDDGNLGFIGTRKSISSVQHLLDIKKINFFEESNNKICPNCNEPYRRTIINGKYEYTYALSSKFSFSAEKIQPYKEKPYLPIYQIRYTISEISTGKILAESNEAIIGGGLLGIYLQAFFGERGDYDYKDYEYMSCGHASKTIASWRPYFSTNPNKAKYIEADSTMITKVFK
ncbi:MAG: hypothetical protein EPO06_11300 [Burkholderiaceae bacterium]|nr:MAG: hypothetical protein EPO06_11300 [Burkholderiaceae bacterium]